MSRYELILPPDYDAATDAYAEHKGWCWAKVLRPDGRFVEVNFYDDVSIGSCATIALLAGNAVFTEQGLIIVPGTSRKNMEAAVEMLGRTGFFEGLVPACTLDCESDAVRHTYELVYPPDFDERAREEFATKGWYGGAHVVRSDGRRVAVTFFELGRLRQEIQYESESTRGFVCFVEPGLIIVPEVTPDQMSAAVKKAGQEGYFETLAALE